MSSDYEIKGWCPGALRPMASGDGLVVRVRPHAGRLTPAEARAVAKAALRHGNGILDLTSRANLQVRGVRDETHGLLIGELQAAGLTDGDIASEAKRNIVVTPFGTGNGRAETLAIAATLEAALARAPALPGKFGFAVDTGTERLLAETSADIRIERDAQGGLMLRADGAPTGLQIEAKAVAEAAVRLATWFVETGGVTQGRGRMARHLAGGARLAPELAGNAVPAPALPSPQAGPTADGVLVGAELGQLRAQWLEALAASCRELRVTPWRMLLAVEPMHLPAIDELIVSPNDPRQRVTACTGAPGCPQAVAPTRALARRLAPHVPRGAHLHVTGCAKGCAMPKAAPYTLLATRDGFSLVRDGCARDAPHRTHLLEATIAADPSIVFEQP